ncbi:MAG: VPLPA-CTERM sorting domain-containing protein [Pseudomonadota bacterium]
MRRFLAATAVLTLGLTSHDAQASTVGNFENLTPTRGLGKATNAYAWSMESHGDDLYVGTYSVNFDWFAAENYLNQIDNSLSAVDAFRRIWSDSPIAPTLGGEIYRYDGHEWTQEYGPGVPGADTGIAGFRGMVKHNGHLYAGTANGPTGPAPGAASYSYGGQNPSVTYEQGDGAKVFVRDDTGTWSELTPGAGPGANNRNASIRSMISANGKLWVGTENPQNPNDPDGDVGPEVWSYTKQHGWVREVKLDNGLAVGELSFVNDKLMIGTWGTGADGGFELLSYDPESGGAPSNVTPMLPGLEGANGVMEIREFNGKTFVGALDYQGGFKLLYTEDQHIDEHSVWSTVTTSGFAEEGGTQSNAYPWSSVEIDGVYYLGTFSTNRSDSPLDTILGVDVPGEGRGEIWYSEDGVSWKILEDNGFDSALTYGVREMVDWQGKLTVGTASNLFVPDLLSSPYAEYANLGFEEFLQQMAAELPQVTAMLTQIGASHEEMAALLGFWEGPLEGEGRSPFKGFEVYSAHPVPLPAGALLLISAMLALPALRRRQQRA